MHQAQWSPERPLPPPVSLASQSHHEKPPEVTCTRRGNPGFPASTRESRRETFFNTSRGQIPLPCLGGISGLFSSGGPSVRFLARYDGEVSEPLVGAREVGSLRVARGSASLLPSHGRGIWPRDVLKKVSRGLSLVEAGNPGFPRLVQVT